MADAKNPPTGPPVKPKKPNGRRSLCTPERTKKIADLLSVGNFHEPVCSAAGISVATFYSWRAKGEDERARRAAGEPADRKLTKYVKFLEDTTRAEATAEVQATALIRKAMVEGDAKSSQWYLERKHPQRWGRSVKRIEHTGTDGGPVAVATAAVVVSGDEEMTAQEAVDLYRQIISGTGDE